MHRLFISYGSNINPLQMATRCTTAKLIGKAILPDWELKFRGIDNKAHATIEPTFSGMVPVSIWDLQQEDEMQLDRYKGFPTLYTKADITIPVGKKNYKVFSYIMAPGVPLGKPSVKYVDIILAGYRMFGFDINSINKALRESMVGTKIERVFCNRKSLKGNPEL